MSGILAMVWTDDTQPEPATLEKLTARMAYRGPVRQNTWWQGHAGLGHALLKSDSRAIEERQPLSLEGTVWIVADARIDDCETLANRLRNRRVDAALLAGHIKDRDAEKVTNRRTDVAPLAPGLVVRPCPVRRR